MKLDDPRIERATITKRGELPAWVQRAIDADLAEARKIECPRKRRLREIEIDMKLDAIKAEHLAGVMR